MVEQVSEYKGAKITHVYRGPPISVTVAVDNQLKLEYNGPVCIDHLTNSYKYGEEAHLITYSKDKPKPVFRVTEHNGWFRLEAHFQVPSLDALCKQWLEYRGYDVRRTRST